MGDTPERWNMAIGDLTAEQQVERALQNARVALVSRRITADELKDVLAQIEEAIKRIAEARGEWR